jgi:type I restriction enzyme, S subunit
MTAAPPLKIPWLKQLPGHWTARRAKYLFRQSQLPTTETDGVVTAFRDGQVTLRVNRRIDGFMLAEQEVGYQGVRRGQLVIHSMDAFAGAIGVSESDGKCTPEYVVLDPRDPDLDVRFFAAALREMARQHFIEISCPSVRERAPRIRYSTFGDMLLPVPPPREQRAIADYLDRKAAAVSALIEKKAQQRVLVEERLQAEITEWVSFGSLQGREPCAASSGRWSHSRLKHLVSFTTSGSRGWAEHYADSGAVFFRIGNLRRGRITLDMSDVQRVAPPPGAEGQRTRVRNGDVLLSITALIGSLAVVEGLSEEAYVSQHVALARPIPERVDPVWLGYALLSDVGQRQLQQAMYGGTKVQLGLEDVRELRLLVPPLSEQVVIGARLSELERELDETADSISRQIDQLREYRQALIATAVTGQLDVAAQEAA